MRGHIMLVSSIETATRVGSAALVYENKILAEYVLNSAKSHVERLLKGINQILYYRKKSTDECNAKRYGYKAVFLSIL